MEIDRRLTSTVHAETKNKCASRRAVGGAHMAVSWGFLASGSLWDMEHQTMAVAATVLGAPNPHELASFYQELLGWDVVEDEPDWVHLVAPGGGAGLSFQTEADHVPPVWPTKGDEQQMMMHLDIVVEDLSDAVVIAERLGASLAEWQPNDDVRVMIDPAGHLFCLFEPYLNLESDTRP
jgi:catechol 2,3-dioxygenase-like lactoylglutathione lyase family enzyme